MTIVLSHVVNSAIEGARLIGTKLFGGSFNGSLAHLKWLRNAQDGSLWEPLKEPPNNMVNESIRHDGTKNLKITSWCRLLLWLGKLSHM